MQNTPFRLGIDVGVRLSAREPLWNWVFVSDKLSGARGHLPTVLELPFHHRCTHSWHHVSHTPSLLVMFGVALGPL